MKKGVQICLFGLLVAIWSGCGKPKEDEPVPRKKDPPKTGKLETPAQESTSTAVATVTYAGKTLTFRHPVAVTGTRDKPPVKTLTIEFFAEPPSEAAVTQLTGGGRYFPIGGDAKNPTHVQFTLWFSRDAEELSAESVEFVGLTLWNFSDGTHNINISGSKAAGICADLLGAFDAGSEVSGRIADQKTGGGGYEFSIELNKTKIAAAIE